MLIAILIITCMALGISGFNLAFTMLKMQEYFANAKNYTKESHNKLVNAMTATEVSVRKDVETVKGVVEAGTSEAIAQGNKAVMKGITESHKQAGTEMKKMVDVAAGSASKTDAVIAEQEKLIKAISTVAEQVRV